VWTHLAVTQGGSAAALYVDGAEAGRTGNVPVAPADFANHLRACYLGRSQYSGDPYLLGALDEVRIYGRALTADEVTELARR
jgi:hypothetical protein